MVLWTWCRFQSVFHCFAAESIHSRHRGAHTHTRTQTHTTDLFSRTCTPKHTHARTFLGRLLQTFHLVALLAEVHAATRRQHQRQHRHHQRHHLPGNHRARRSLCTQRTAEPSTLRTEFWCVWLVPASLGSGTVKPEARILTRPQNRPKHQEDISEKNIKIRFVFFLTQLLQVFAPFSDPFLGVGPSQPENGIPHHK